MPAAGVVNAFARIALFQFRQIQTGTKVVTLAMDHGGTRFRGQVLKHISQRFDQGVVQGIALGRAAQAHHGHCALHLQGHAVGGCTFQDRVRGVCHQEWSLAGQGQRMQ